MGFGFGGTTKGLQVIHRVQQVVQFTLSEVYRFRLWDASLHRTEHVASSRNVIFLVVTQAHQDRQPAHLSHQSIQPVPKLSALWWGLATPGQLQLKVLKQTPDRPCVDEAPAN